MKNIFFASLLFSIIFGCQKTKETSLAYPKAQNSIQFAQGLSIFEYENYTLVQVTNPWPTDTSAFTYVFTKNGAIVPDSLKIYPQIQVPIQKIVVTSTTHIPGLELLDEVASLKGFPNTSYISATSVRSRIDAGAVRAVGSNQDLNIEVLLEMQPDLIMGFGVDGQKSSYEILEKNGLFVVFNGDWTEQDPLGRAEWIKLFGVIFDKTTMANTVFDKIVAEYNETKAIAKQSTKKPTVFSGSIYQDQWYLPQGDSWGAKFLADAQANYLWAHTKGTGSLSFSFETILETAIDADFWIGPGQFTSYDQLYESNQNYKYFKAVKDKKVYSFSSKKGPTEGVIYYEEASSRPDLVLKDLVKILHPELLPNEELYFFEPLQ
jgi:iron complex transport system substrate-binding protein